MNKNYADILESFMIGSAKERVPKFGWVFCDGDVMLYKTATAVVNGKTYDLTKYKYLHELMEVIIADKWSEKDFVKFIEENINYTGKSLEIYYWAEGDAASVLSEQDKKNQKLWNSFKFICVSEDGAGNTLFYSKAKHCFVFVNHERYLSENLENMVSWKDAIQGFGYGTVISDRKYPKM